MQIRQVGLLLETMGSAIRYRIDSRIKYRAGAIMAATGIVALTAVEPAMAQEAGSVDVCETDLAQLFNNFMLLLTGIAPLGAGSFIGWNLFRAGTTGKSDKKKQYRENISSAVIYGGAATMLFGLMSIGAGLIPGGVACL